MKNNFKFLVAAFAIVALSVTTASAAYTHSTTLKLGSRGTQVMALQQTLNMTSCKVAATGAGSTGMETTYFGPATTAAVKCFQAANGATADGVVGPMTGAKLVVVSNGSVSGNFPAGCTSAAGYSSTTGAKCSALPSTPGSLQGGAGELTLSETSTDVEDDVEEGKTEIVFGQEASADDSDIAITNVKVRLAATNGALSTRLEKYVDEVTVWLGDKKVGSASADDFNEDDDVYTKSISLSGAVISEDDEEKLYVSVTAVDTVEDDAQTFDVSIEDVRYTDATGAILSTDGDDENNFGFLEEGADDELSIKSSSTNPDATTLKVDEDEKSDDYLVLAFKLDVDEDSSDIDVLEMPVVITLANTTGTIDSVINEVYVKVGSNTFNADRNGAGAGLSSTFDVDFDEDFTIDAGDSEEVKVYVVFNKLDGNYLNGTTVTASVAGSAIEAEGADELDASGTGSGKTHSLNTSAAALSAVKWDVPSTGSLIDFLFTVEAEDEDFDVLLASITSNDTITGTATVATPTLERVSGDADAISGGFTVQEGDTATFRVRYGVTGANGTYANVTIESVAGQEVDEDDQLSPTATRNLN